MSIDVRDHGASVQVAVLGALEGSGAAAQLIQAMQRSPCPQEMRLSFYDAVVLPREVVEAIAALLQQGVSLTIEVYNNYLAHYLIRLGLPVRYIPHNNPRRRELTPVRALVIGGSADSLDKMLHLVECLPAAPLAVFVVQHLLEDAESYLDRLLQARTEHYQVLMPRHMQSVSPGFIYVAPPGYHLKLNNGLLYLTHDSKVRFARPSIDVLFESVAEEYGADAMGVLLCGMGDDGVIGIQRLREHGAFVIVEDSADCEAKLLTNAARQAGCYDHVLNLQEIASFLLAALEQGGAQEPSEAAVAAFLRALYSRYGYNYSGYQDGTTRRRIDKLMGLLDIHQFFEFQRQVLTNPETFQRFFLEMSVEVTGFFRHPQQYLRLREEILPYLNSFPTIKIWSAGCASGEEAYSLAIVLDEMGMLEKSRIYSTDINPYALEQARAGLYPLAGLAENRRNYLAGGGSRDFSEYADNNGLYLKMAERLRQRILFHPHDLAQDGVFNEFQLILCRNVLIYFRVEQQQNIMAGLAKSLHPDGFLVLGDAEALSPGRGERFFAPWHKNKHIFRLVSP